MSELERIGKFLSVVKETPSRSRWRPLWRLINNGREMLGVIRWYSNWKEYIFQPYEGSEYSVECLADIKAFLDKCNAEAK